MVSDIREFVLTSLRWDGPRLRIGGTVLGSSVEVVCENVVSWRCWLPGNATDVGILILEDRRGRGLESGQWYVGDVDEDKIVVHCGDVHIEP